VINVRIGRDVEIDDQPNVAAIGIDRVHVVHVVHATHLLLDRRRDRFLNRQRSGPGVLRLHLNLRRRDLWILRDRQRENADTADERHQNRDNDRDNGPPDEKLGHFLGLLLLVRFCNQRVGGRGPVFGGDCRSFARFLESLHNNFVAWLQTFRYFPHRTDAFAHFHRANADLVIFIDNCHLIIALQLVYRFLRNHHCTLFHVGDETDLSELSRPQNISWIWKRYFVADRASLWI